MTFPSTWSSSSRCTNSPNSAGVVIDAVRCCKLGIDRGLTGALEGPSSYFMKSPPRQVSDSQARELTEQFIAGVPDNAGNGRGHKNMSATDPVAQPVTSAAD